MSVEHLQGAWRIEEAPRRNNQNHAYGIPNTHWLIIGDRGIVVRDRAPSSLAFDFRIRVDATSKPHECSISGEHGGTGYLEIDGDLLFVGLGLHGGRPPRFASDCGNFFAFQRDPDFVVPAVPEWSRSQIDSQCLGSLIWNRREPEYMGDWIGKVRLSDGTECEIWANDYLVPIKHFLSRIEAAFLWLQQNLDQVKLVCAEKVADWIEDESQYASLVLDDVADTIAINVLAATDGKIHLWAGTSIPIDHSIKVWLEFSGGSIRATGVSIEG